jgi:hypothetical protein
MSAVAHSTRGRKFTDDQRDCCTYANSTRPWRRRATSSAAASLTSVTAPTGGLTPRRRAMPKQG